MGGISSSQRGSTEEDNASTTSVYRYPPRSGNYFSTHFIMGGEKFDSPQPESFLFGENSDLNYLGSKPVPFPYPPPQANEPTKTLKALMNIRRDSLHLTKVKGPDWKDDPGKYNISFTYDSDIKSSITIYYLATEETTPTSISYTSKYEHLQTPTYSYPKGAGQIFNQSQHIFEPVPLEMELIDNRGEGVLPVVIHCVADEGDQPRQSHITVGVVEKNSDGGFSLKTLKQKLFVDGLCYLIQEIYGVEKKVGDEMIDEEFEDSGAECVVCMCDSRDTIILPCRHLCLCYTFADSLRYQVILCAIVGTQSYSHLDIFASAIYTCADSLRYQANNCPICRAPFRALLQIRALQKTGNSATHPALAAEEQTEGVPPGYEIVSLVEALNGPFAPPPPPPLPAETAETVGGKKKKSKRRGSKTSGGTSSKDGKRSAIIADKSALEEKLTPPAEAVNLELTESRLCFGGDSEDVTVIDEKVPRRSSVKSLEASSGGKKVMEDTNKIKLEVHSQDSLGSMADSDIIEEELSRVKLEGATSRRSLQLEGSNSGLRIDSTGGSRLELVGHDQLEHDQYLEDDGLEDDEEEETKEPTTEDELLKEDKLFESGCSLYKKKDQIIQLTDDESLDAVGRGVDEGEGYFSVGSGEEDDVEVVSIRGGKVLHDAYHQTPRSSDQSSQESSTSVSSSKQLLKSNSSVVIGSAASRQSSAGLSAVSKQVSLGSTGAASGTSATSSSTSSAGKRRKQNRSSVAPSPEQDPIDTRT